MPKTGDLLRELKQAGFYLQRHGGSHDIWQHANGRQVVVPRHSRDIPTGTYYQILRKAGVR